MEDSNRNSSTTKLTRPVLRALLKKHNGEFHGPRVEHMSMEAEDFWRFVDEVVDLAWQRRQPELL